MMLRILFFYPAYGRYGVSKAFIRLLSYLAEKSLYLIVAIDSADAELGSILSSCPSLLLERRGGEGKLAFARRALKQGKPDIGVGVQNHNSYWLILAKSLSLSKLKIVSWEHSSPQASLRAERGKFWQGFAVVRRLFGAATHAFFCVSVGIADELQQLWGQDRRKVFYVPNIIFSSADISGSRRGTHEKNNARKRFISVGRLDSGKGLDLALAAFRAITHLDWEYILVGDGPERRKLEAMVSESDLLRERVTFVGWSSEVARLMQEADFIILPSYYEGLPTVLVEAAINGVPIVATDCPTGPAEIVRNGINGYLVPVGDAGRLREAICDAICNRNLYNSAEFVGAYEAEAAGGVFFRTLLRVWGKEVQGVSTT